MSRRKDRRYVLALPGHISGYDAEGTAFREAVCTLDLCAQGARLSKVRHTLKTGQELMLEYKNHRVRVRVVWLGELRTPTEGQVGLKAEDSIKKIADFTEIFTDNYIDTWVQEAEPTRDPAYGREE